MKNKNNAVKNIQQNNLNKEIDKAIMEKDVMEIRKKLRTIVGKIKSGK